MGSRAQVGPSYFSLQIVEAIRQLLPRSGMTTAELIETSKFSPNYYYVRMRADAPFDADDIEQIATALSMTVAEFVTLAASTLVTEQKAQRRIATVDKAELARRLTFLSNGLPVDAVMEMAGPHAPFDAQDWQRLSSGSGDGREYFDVLTALAAVFDVDARYLYQTGDKDLAETIEAQKDFARAVEETGVTSIAARAFDEISPAELRALTKTIRTLHHERRGPDAK
ncbi:hypothetical protein [Rathayibacter sp. SD072]|uniref:hypothetical protein n=1 Tax=Rathayibacter sp. SD072 TaxID=2781731 RepID=UPI001A975958|nr:hypothetical protein [Rathayibacter sp. SD072]MBO0985031.1 hypothetical protein [Rathayibacter sp. SD072]